MSSGSNHKRGGYASAAASNSSGLSRRNSSKGRDGGDKPRRRPSDNPSSSGDGHGGPAATGGRNRGWETASNARKTDKSPAKAPPGFSHDKAASSQDIGRIMRNRFLFVTQSLVGSVVEVHTKSKSVYEGVFYTCGVDDFSVVLKEASMKSGSPAKPFERGSTITIPSADIVQLYAASVSLVEKQDTEGIMTDTDISGTDRSDLYGRRLEVAHHLVSDTDKALGGLEDETPAKRNSKSKDGGWDQFQTNENLFGVKSTYDENMYTTYLDKKTVSEKMLRKAETIAREIESQTSTNFHLAEERGQASLQDNDNIDEETLYSSVIRSEPADAAPLRERSKNAYVPPALRGKAAGSKQGADGGKKSEGTGAKKSEPKSSLSPKKTSYAEKVAGQKKQASSKTENIKEKAPSPTNKDDAGNAKEKERGSRKKESKGQPKTEQATISSPKTSVAKPHPPSAAAATVAAGPSSSGTSSHVTSPATKVPQSPKPAATKPILSPKTKKDRSASPRRKDEAPKEVKENGKVPAPVDTATSKSENGKVPAAEQPEEKGKPKLNPNAKEFVFSIAAKPFVPKFNTPPAPAPTTPPMGSIPVGMHIQQMPPFQMQPGMQPMQMGGMYRRMDEWQQYDPNMMMEDGSMAQQQYQMAAHFMQIPPQMMAAGRPMPYPTMLPPNMQPPLQQNFVFDQQGRYHPAMPSVMGIPQPGAAPFSPGGAHIPRPPHVNRPVDQQGYAPQRQDSGGIPASSGVSHEHDREQSMDDSDLDGQSGTPSDAEVEHRSSADGSGLSRGGGRGGGRRGGRGPGNTRGRGRGGGAPRYTRAQHPE